MYVSEECKEGVVEITSLQDLVDYYGDYPDLPSEFNQILDTLEKLVLRFHCT